MVINGLCSARERSRVQIPDEPPNVLPVVRVPGRERRLLETMQLAIGEFITDSSQGLPPSPRV